MLYSVVIPVYAGEKTVEALFLSLKDFFENRNLAMEVIFVFDCGPDKSWQKIEDLKLQFGSLVKGIRLSRNYGQHNAIICGFEFASGDFIITMDEDLQHDPQDIEKLLICLSDGNYDVVYGTYLVKNHSLFRNVTSRILSRLIQIGIPDVHRSYSSFRLIKSDVAKATIDMRNSYTFLDGYLSWITQHIGSCDVTHHERKYGKSSYNLKKLFNHAINIFITFSNFPIRVVTFLSLIVILFSLGFSIYFIFRKMIWNDIVPGYTSLIVVIGLGVGLIMFAMGIIGEYIFRINLKTTRRPNYHVSKKII